MKIEVGIGLASESAKTGTMLTRGFFVSFFLLLSSFVIFVTFVVKIFEIFAAWASHFELQAFLNSVLNLPMD